MRKNKGQVTLFIVLAIVIVVGIVIAIIALRPTADSTVQAEPGSTVFVQSCVRDLVEASAQKILNGGGVLQTSKFISYNDKIHNYLCYTADYYTPCYNLHPALEEFAEFQIREDTKEGVQFCFDAYRADLEEKNFAVSGGPTNYTIDLLPGKISIILEKEISISSDTGSSSISDFSTAVLSPLHTLIQTAREIVNNEVQFCNFEHVGYMILYPSLDIKKISYQDSIIYRVIDRLSGDELKFAVRSCALPPGF